MFQPTDFTWIVICNTCTVNRGYFATFLTHFNVPYFTVRNFSHCFILWKMLSGSALCMTSIKIFEVLFGAHFDENMGWQSYPIGRGRATLPPPARNPWLSKLCMKWELLNFNITLGNHFKNWYGSSTKDLTISSRPSIGLLCHDFWHFLVYFFYGMIIFV